MNPRRRLSPRNWCAVALLLAALLAGLWLAPTARAQESIDRVRRYRGIDSGQITTITPLAVTLVRGGVATQIPVDEIESVVLADEPRGLGAVRLAAQGEDWQQAARLLADVTVRADARDAVVAEVAFYRMLTQVRLAIAGRSEADAGVSTAREFLSKHRASFHLPAAFEAMGDALQAAGDRPGAIVEYQKLAKARSEYFLMRSQWLVGRVRFAGGDAAGAVRDFDAALASRAEGPAAESVRRLATLDRAVAVALGGDATAAIDAVTRLLSAAAEEDAELLARGYNALGSCYLAARDRQSALIAFLHTELLYRSEAPQHAEALYRLTKLWNELGRSPRAGDAAAELLKRYPHSEWATRLQSESNDSPAK